MNEIELIDFCEKHFTDYAVCKALKCEELCKDDDCPLVRVFNGYRAALREKQERETNEPLTRDELFEMGGTPVYCVDCNGNGKWGFVNLNDLVVQDSDFEDWEFCYYGWKDNGKLMSDGWLAYRRPPKGENNGTTDTNI